MRTALPHPGWTSSGALGWWTASSDSMTSMNSIPVRSAILASYSAPNSR